jgi:hypothetical protein
MMLCYVNRLLCLIMSVRLNSQGAFSVGIPDPAIWRELGCPPLDDMATARRCRLYIKAQRGGLGRIYILFY